MERINPRNCLELNGKQIKNLEGNGILTMMDLVLAPKEIVTSSIGSENFNYDQFRKNILKRIRVGPVTLKEAITDFAVISTGIISLDEMLRGGLHPGDLIQVYGPAASGKTQLCLYLTSQIIKSLKFTVIYFDMKNDFTATRLNQMSHNEESLANVCVIKPKNLESLLFTLDKIKMEEDAGLDPFYSKCKLIVIDSAAMAIYPVIQKDNGYSWRFYQETLLNKLQELAYQIGLSVVLVNHGVRGWNPPGQPFKKLQWKAGMGKYWEARIPIRIQMIKASLPIKVEPYYCQPNSFVHFTGELEKCTRSNCKGTFFNFCINKDGKTFPIVFNSWKWKQQPIPLHFTRQQ